MRSEKEELEDSKGPSSPDLVPSKHRLQTTPRDELLLRDLGEFRYLNTRQIARLHFGHIKLAQRRMRRLLRLGLVLRVPVNGGARAGFHEWLYALPPRRGGSRAMAESSKEPIPVLDPSRGVGPTYVAHHVCLTDFRIWLREAVNQTAGRFKVQFVPGYATGTAAGRRRLAAIDVGSPHGTLIPDGLFALHRSDERSALFFLEIDQGTEPLRGKHLSSISSKFKQYRRAYDARLFDRFSEEFGYPFEGFRTLFVVPDESRASGILDVARSEDFAPLAWTIQRSSLLLAGNLSSPSWRDGDNRALRSLDE